MKQSARRIVRGPDGTILSMEQLPLNLEARWTARKKAAVLFAIEGGMVSMEDARKRWELSIEEFMEWRNKYKERGIHGLRVFDYGK